MMPLPVWLPGPMFLLGGFSLWSDVPTGGFCLWFHVPSRGVFLTEILPETSWTETPVYGKERAVRILLECILLNIFIQIFCFLGFTSLCEKFGLNAKYGTDKLTKTLSTYMGSLVQEILKYEGDVLKYAGMLCTGAFVQKDNP